MDVYDERFLDGRRYLHVRAAGVRRLELWPLSRVGLQWDFIRPHGHSVLPFGLRCQRHGALFSSVSLLHVHRMGLFTRCVLFGTGQEFDGLEDVAHTCDGVGLGDHCKAEAGTYPCVWDDSTSLKMNNPLVMCSSEGSLASVSSASARHDCNALALHEGCPAICAESYEAKWRSTALTTQIHHFDGKPNGAKGLQFTSCVKMTLLRCSHRPERKVRSSGLHELDCWRDLHRGKHSWLRACFW